MKKSSLIGHVLEIYEAIVKTRSPADRVVGRFFRERRYLGASDRRFISETAYEMLRNSRLLELLARRAYSVALSVEAPPGPLHPLLLYAAYSVTTSHQESQSVANDIGSICRGTFPDGNVAPFLQALQDTSEAIVGDSAQDFAIRYSFPEFVVQEWLDTYGTAETRQLCEASNVQAPIAIRVNTLLTTVDECQRALGREGIVSERTLLSPFGLILPRRINIHSLVTFKQGFFEMQDEGSQLVSLLLESRPGENIVDACAGGGGKSLHVAALMKNLGTIHAVEIEEARSRDLTARCNRSGVSIVQPHIKTREGRMPDHLYGKIDKVLIDAPCSGTGTFRRNPGAKLALTPEFVEDVLGVQRSILDSFAPLVRPGGRLVYATCSLLRRENEEAVEWFLQSHPEFSLISAGDILSKNGVSISFATPFMKLLPHRNGTDGFFAAVFHRTGPGR